MGWSGRAPILPESNLRQRHPARRSTPCPRRSFQRSRSSGSISARPRSMSSAWIAVDRWYCDRGGRAARSRCGSNMPPCLVGIEACVGAHHLSRKLRALGHDARLMPAKYVRPYSKGQKNDFRDAEAIAEAVQRPTMKFVATNTAEQLICRPCIACVSGWSPRRATQDPGSTFRCPVTPYDADDRGTCRRLAAAR